MPGDFLQVPWQAWRGEKLGLGIEGSCLSSPPFMYLTSTFAKFAKPLAKPYTYETCTYKGTYGTLPLGFKSK